MSRYNHHEIQSGIVYFCRNYCPDAAWIFHVENEGKRTARQGDRAKREGLLPGVFDLFLPVARGGYHGLWGEVKVKPDKLSKDQIAFERQMIAAGYKTDVWWSTKEGIDAITAYLKL
jgi:hypothetical protein